VTDGTNESHKLSTKIRIWCSSKPGQSTTTATGRYTKCQQALGLNTFWVSLERTPHRAIKAGASSFVETCGARYPARPAPAVMLSY